MALKVIFARYMPHLSMVLAQISYTILYFLVEASFNEGLNPHVYITYRYIFAGLAMSPFAYFLERKSRPKMTLALFLEIFLLSLIGVGLTMNMYFASLRYTSPTFVASAVNTISSLTFVIAIILRMEVVDVRSPRGLGEVAGTLTSLAGVSIITLYKGAEFRSLRAAPVHLKRVSSVHENWVKGSILTVASCISWALWYILQAVALKKYPAQLSLTCWINCIGAVQSAVYAVFVEHRPTAWTIKMFSIQFWAVTYSGIVCSDICIFLQLWCMKRKGPVFVTVFTPLSAVMVAFSAYFILGEKLQVGSILGGAIAIIGLYLLLWGKEKDQTNIKTQDQQQSSSHCDVVVKVPEEGSDSREKEIQKQSREAFTLTW
ncbi:WAT1-related protein At2g39510-like [Hibiscus syriacus]|uniref:WAT1-related protein At2g39510-like n=1 Tax=Hibiscus syriacus TaxID=106335 RepID=UPI001922D10D|nr:WAT1-related protein At2g39510-like [Hibiscus syriacus]